MNSSARAPRWSIGAPVAAYSSAAQPMPSPTSSRPSQTASSVAACLASSSGENHGMLSTATPSRARSV